ncbi:hypothetical protein M011DRAFT_497660 [Sporormia fimetaria CBS 119925]|uniref:ER transporter 6TM N-terminal domain-containing protein n=1 Tax=Sporormia fimetaria CBS 119925 TaxID=1340428 RepID=A0A6A6UXG4_9PLEO|nr:hypothetical protein M011DRAFT_497660 [Sporormia fimetaria CBS 119925]
MDPRAEAPGGPGAASDDETKSSTEGSGQDAAQRERSSGEEAKKKSNIMRLWKKTGLDTHTVLLMMKAGLPPTIALAIYQADAVARTYATLGYLIAIISILGFCIMPRAKFIQTMILNILATGVGAGVCMLMVWTGVQARLHTTAPGPPQRYNSSQSAVIGVWLFFQIWLINALKAKFPQHAFPAILYSIFVNVAAAYGPQFRTVAQARGFVQQLLEAFLTGLAIATFVSLLIYPMTSRKVVIRGMKAYIITLRDTLQAHKRYLHSLETTDVFSKWKSTPLGDGKDSKPEIKAEIEALKSLNTSLARIHGKLHSDLPFAKREVAYGKLTPDDFEVLYKHLREIMRLAVGLGSLVDLFDRTAERMNWARGPDSTPPTPDVEALHTYAVNEWHELMRSIRQPVDNIVEAMDGGLTHTLIKLRLDKPAKKTARSYLDEEAKGGCISPGDADYVKYLEQQSNQFYSDKEATLRRWLETKGLTVRDDFFDDSINRTFTGLEEFTQQPTDVHQRDQQELYFLLYVLFLLYAISQAVIHLAKYADTIDVPNTTSKFILPGRKRMKKWISGLFKAQDSNDDDEATLTGMDREYTVVYMGEAYKRKKDPEHLPPENAWERFGEGLRSIARFLKSAESSFGFRAACATMTVAIVNFLRHTQTFFLEQRLIWALIMVSISMTPTAGQSVWAFFLRMAGTAMAMVVSWLIWYIPGQHTVGIIILLWFFISLGTYIPLKRPDLIIVGLIALVTTALIVGYELEVRKLGAAIAESNGQPAYPIYLLAPYRLATVVGGLAVAFIWTFFPFPISEHSALRQKLGGSLYLSANYYSIVHETVMARIRGDEGDPADKTSPGYQLSKARNKVFAKQTLLLQGLRTHSSFVRWGLPIGGKFPSKEYENITQLLTNILSYSALIVYASEAFTLPKYNDAIQDPAHLQWIHDFRRVVKEARITSHEVTSTLALLSSSITTGQPLPPYLSPPQGYRLTKRMELIDPEILSVRHITEPGYAAFAVLQISTSCISMDLEKLVRAVRRLVGELDFSFHVVSTRSSSVVGLRDKQD